MADANQSRRRIYALGYCRFGTVRRLDGIHPLRDPIFSRARHEISRRVSPRDCGAECALLNVLFYKSTGRKFLAKTQSSRPFVARFWARSGEIGTQLLFLGIGVILAIAGCILLIAPRKRGNARTDVPSLGAQRVFPITVSRDHARGPFPSFAENRKRLLLWSASKSL